MLISLLKKLVWTAGAIALIWLLFGYSTEKPVPDDGKIHIRFWHLTGQKEQEPYTVEKFNASQDRIVVESVAIPWYEHEKKVLTAIISGDPPDVMTQITPLAQWASRMALVPLDAFMQRDQFDTTMFFPALWKEMKWRGRSFGLPSNTASYALFYNKDLFREAGLDPEKPPQTWQEVIEYSRKLLKRDADGRITQMGFIPEYGTLPGHGDLPTAVVLAWQLGSKFLFDDGARASMTEQETIRALQWIVDFYDEYDLEEITAFMAGFGYADQHAFVSNKVAMMMMAHTYLDFVDRYGSDIDYGVCVIPSFPGRPSASSSGSWWMGIPRGSKNPEAAWEFMKFVVDRQIQLETVEAMDEPLFPANHLAAGDLSIKDRETTEVFIEQMNVSHSPAIVPLSLIHI